MKKILAIILVVLGSFLEVFYNAYRYHQDGIPLSICIIIGLALNICLIVCVIEKRPVLAVMLILFSIISTSAGQTFAIINKDKTEIAEQINPKKIELAKENELLNKEKQEINAQINDTVKTLEDRFTWKNTLEKAEERKRQIEIQIEKNKEDLRISESVYSSGTGETIYSLYSRLLKGRVSTDWLKVILHTILSIFIAIMSPIGIAALERDKNTQPESNGTAIMTRDDWIRWFYRETRYGRYKAPPDVRMKEYAYIAGKEWKDDIHAEMLKTCIKTGILTDKGVLSGKEEDIKKVIKSTEND